MLSHVKHCTVSAKRRAEVLPNHRALAYPEPITLWIPEGSSQQVQWWLPHRPQVRALVTQVGIESRVAGSPMGLSRPGERGEVWKLKAGRSVPRSAGHRGRGGKGCSQLEFRSLSFCGNFPFPAVSSLILGHELFQVGVTRKRDNGKSE